MLTALAHAKVNLGLEILGRRADGLHEVVTILQEIDLADRLSITEAEGLTVESNLPELAADPGNLVLRAARALQDAAGVSRGASIYLEKVIPLAAGLGGGSSDAAAALLALSRLWQLDWDASRLERVARALGTDVAFFLRGGTQLATGSGDTLQPLPTPRVWIVVVSVPSPYPDKTRRLYSALQPKDWSDGSEVARIAAALRAGAPIEGAVLPSGFARATRDLIPSVETALVALNRAGGVASLCGAGPSVISVHGAPGDAALVAARLRAEGFAVVVAATVDRSCDTTSVLTSLP
jgi:4-diphosphocytidyl-2-C-methyl-D-erythritol kinase